MTRTTPRPQLDGENPWPGLESFQEDERAFFFGRERESAALLQHVLDAAVTVLYGRSGLGKTSLLRAGLFPVLREQRLLPEQRFLPVYVRFEVNPGAPPLARQLHQSVHDSIQAELPGAVLPSDEESLWEYLHRRDIELRTAENDRLTPVIVLDQFEELFTLGERAPDLVEAFRNDLGDLAENRIPADLSSRIEADEAVAARFDLRSRNFKLLISLREDFLPDLEEWCRLIPALGRSRMRLRPLKRDDAFDAVHKPARDLMTAALAKRVVDIVAGENLHRDGETAVGDVEHGGNGQGASYLQPALLSLFCRELNEKRKRLGQERFEEQLVEGAKSDILSNYYSTCVRDLPHVAEFVEDQLITEKGFRNSYAREDAVPSILTDDELDRLIGSRLLGLVEYHGAQRIELTHDVLTHVVREHRDRRRGEAEKAALAARAQQERHALEQAAAQREAELDREREARLESERVGRRLKRLSRVLALVCVVAIVLAVVAVWYAHSAKLAREAANARSHEALAERLTSQALAMLSGGQPGSELKAIDKLLAAQHIPANPDIGALLTALKDRPRLRRILDGGILSGDGSRVAIYSASGIKLLNTQTGQPVDGPFGKPGLPTAISADGRYVAMVDKHDQDAVIRVWDSAAGQPVGLPMTGSRKLVSPGAVSADGRRVAAADGDDILRLWDVQTGRQIGGALWNHDPPVTALVFSPDGHRLASAGLDNTVRLWDADSGAQIGEPLRGGDPRLGSNDAVLSVAFSPDGHTIAAGGHTVRGWNSNAGSPLRLWNADSGAAVGTAVVGNYYGNIMALAFSPDAKRIATGGSDKTVRLWDAHTGQPIGNAFTFADPVAQVAFTEGGKRIVSCSGGTCEISNADPYDRLPEETGGSKAAELAAKSMSGEIEGYGLEAHGDPRIVVTSNGTLRYLDPDTGQQIGPVIISDAVRGMTRYDVSSDRRWLAVPGPDNNVRVIDTSNGRLYGEPMKGHDGRVNAVAFSPDGKVLASASDDKTVRLWDWRRGLPIGQPMTGHEDDVAEVAFSDDGRLLYSRSYTSIRIWDPVTGHAIGKPIGGADHVFSGMSIRHDGRRIATREYGDHTIRQWDVESGEPVGTLTGHNNSITSVEYSPDGRYLASVGADSALRFWDSASGDPVGEWVDIAALGVVDFLTFSHDGHRLYFIAGGWSPNGHPPFSGGGIWQLPAPAAWADALCDEVVSNPSEQQWKDWISPDIPYQEPCRGKPRSNL
jgi:WD40 repeat protein